MEKLTDGLEAFQETRLYRPKNPEAEASEKLLETIRSNKKAQAIIENHLKRIELSRPDMVDSPYYRQLAESRDEVMAETMYYESILESKNVEPVEQTLHSHPTDPLDSSIPFEICPELFVAVFTPSENIVETSSIRDQVDVTDDKKWVQIGSLDNAFFSRVVRPYLRMFAYICSTTPEIYIHFHEANHVVGFRYLATSKEKIQTISNAVHNAALTLCRISSADRIEMYTSDNATKIATAKTIKVDGHNLVTTENFRSEECRLYSTTGKLLSVVDNMDLTSKTPQINEVLCAHAYTFGELSLDLTAYIPLDKKLWRGIRPVNPNLQANLVPYLNMYMKYKGLIAEMYLSDDQGHVYGFAAPGVVTPKADVSVIQAIGEDYAALCQKGTKILRLETFQRDRAGVTRIGACMILMRTTIRGRYSRYVDITVDIGEDHNGFYVSVEGPLPTDT